MDRRLELILEMTPAIWIHLVAVSLAVIVGAWVLLRKKGDARHRLAGRIWIGLMFVAATSAFWVREINDGGFSPIHILSIWTLISLVGGVVAIRLRGRFHHAVQWHFGFLQSLYATGLLIAGGFTFLPHRLLGRLTFGETWPLINLAFVASTMLVGIWLLLRTFQRARL